MVQVPDVQQFFQSPFPKFVNAKQTNNSTNSGDLQQAQQVCQNATICSQLHRRRRSVTFPKR
jgi:hypothetical protein